MAEYIEREALVTKLNDIAIDYIKDNSIQCSIAAGTVIDIRDNAVMKIPTADVAEVKHGYWEVCSDEYEICASEFVCSNCKEDFCSSELTDEQFFEMMKFCPNCGARMDGKDI